MRKLTNGDIIFPHRGDPFSIPPLEGYERDQTDLFVFHPSLPPCTKRVFRQITSGCCGTECKMFCGEKKIVQLTCLECKSVQSPNT